MLNSFSTLGTWANLSIDVAEVDKSFEEFLTESQLIKILFVRLKQHQQMLLRYYQSLVSQRQLV